MITFNRKELATELSLLQSVAEVKGTIAALSFIRMVVTSGIAELTASDIDRTLITSLPVEGDDEIYCVPMAQLLAAVRLFDGESVTFNLKPNERVEVKCGKSRHLFITIPTDQYPQVGVISGEQVTLDSALLKTGLERTARCADTKGGSRWTMQGVCFDTKDSSLRLAATDSSHLAVSPIPVESSDFKFILPNAAIAALQSLLEDVEGPISLIRNEMSVQFTAGDRRLICRLIDGTFPQWELIVPKTFDHEISLPLEETLLALRRCCVTARELTLIRNPLKLILYSDRLEVESFSGDETSFETLAVQCPSLNGEPLTVKINGDQVISYLKTAREPVLKLKDNRTQMLFEDRSSPGYLYVTMPLTPDA